MAVGQGEVPTSPWGPLRQEGEKVRVLCLLQITMTLRACHEDGCWPWTCASFVRGWKAPWASMCLWPVLPP